VSKAAIRSRNAVAAEYGRTSTVSSDNGGSGSAPVAGPVVKMSTPCSYRPFTSARNTSTWPSGPAYSAV
jgi:hypothetical protein